VKGENLIVPSVWTPSDDPGGSVRSGLPDGGLDPRWRATCERPLDLVAPVPVDPTGRGGPTKRQASGPRFRQTSPGLYVPTSVNNDIVEQRIFEQAHRIKTYGAVTGWAALRWRGAVYFDGTSVGGRATLPVPLVVDRYRLAPDPRVDISEAHIAPSEWTWNGGIRCATVQRALFDAMRSAPDVRSAVVCMDMAAAGRLISVSLMTRYVLLRPAWTGVPLVRAALLLASDNSCSPRETRLRLIWVIDAGLAAPLCNVPVFGRDGSLLGFPDLFDPVAGMVGEYDGQAHKDMRRHRRDVDREARYRDHGLEYFTVVGGDMLDRRKVVDRIHATRNRALFTPADQRLWTLEPPAWWVAADDLDTYLVRTQEAAYLIRD
jgi:hypothetical protein